MADRMGSLVALMSVSLVGGIVFGGVWVLSEPNFEGSQEPERVLTAPQPEDSSLVQGSDGAQGGRVLDGQLAADASGEVVEQPTVEVEVGQRHSDAFFEPPKLTPEGNYISNVQKVTWGPGCEGNSIKGEFVDLRDYVAQQHGLPLMSVPPSSIPDPAVDGASHGIGLVHLNQYYRDTQLGEFLQLSIVRGGAGVYGQGYRIERYRFRDPEMSEMVGSDVVAPANQRFELGDAEVRSAFEGELSALVAPRFIRGTRGLVYRSAVLPRTGALARKASLKPLDAIIEMTGGLVSAYSTADVSCESTPFVAEAQTKTLCSCYLVSQQK